MNGIHIVNAYKVIISWMKSVFNVVLFFSTLRQDCPAGISLRLTNDAKSLKIVRLEEKHNHEVNEVCTKYDMIKS